jgi:two-component system chemotaxis response regulator CheY
MLNEEDLSGNIVKRARDTNMRILIVDDSRAMRMIVRRTLRQAGFDGCAEVEAANGREALDQVQAVAPDLILSDWNMPEMNGLELLRELKRRGSSATFGFVTSESSPDMQVAALQEGALFFITKPFTADKFQSTLEPLLRS